MASDSACYSCNRNAVERVFKELKRRTEAFATHFRNAQPQTAETWLQAFAVCLNQLIWIIPPGEGQTGPVRKWARNRDSGAGLPGKRTVGPQACGLPVELSTARGSVLRGSSVGPAPINR